MTKKKAFIKRPITKGGLRNLIPVGGNPGPLYQGKRSGPAEVATVRERLPVAAKKLNIKMLRFAIEAVRTGTAPAAYQNLYPKCKYESAHRRGWQLMKDIEKRLGGEDPTNEFFYELSGLTLLNFTTKISDAMNATVQKDFVLPRSGAIISTPPVPDHQTRLAATKLGLTLRKMIGDEEEKARPVVVNVVSYLQGPIEQQTPWPGGGRCAPDGVLRPTVGPESFAALVARGAIRPALTSPDGALGEPKNRD